MEQKQPTGNEVLIVMVQGDVIKQCMVRFY